MQTLYENPVLLVAVGVLFLLLLGWILFGFLERVRRRNHEFILAQMGQHPQQYQPKSPVVDKDRDNIYVLHKRK